MRAEAALTPPDVDEVSNIYSDVEPRQFVRQSFPFQKAPRIARPLRV
jgi:hypothetical protein